MNEKYYVLSIDPGVVNLSYCLLERRSKNIIDWDVFTIGSSDLMTQAKKLHARLSEIKLPGVTEVVVELQMGINVRTNRVVAMITMFYATHPQISGLRMFSPKHKISYYKRAPEDPPMAIVNGKEYASEKLAKLDSSKAYYRTKRTLVEHCVRIISRKQYEMWKNKFLWAMKKDDLADSFIQGLAFIDQTTYDAPKSDSYTFFKME